MAKKNREEDPAEPTGEQPRQHYVIKASAWPQFSAAAQGGHNRLLALTLDDLVLLRDLYQGLRDGRELKALAEAMGVGRKKCYQVLEAAASVGAQGSRGDFVRKLRKADAVEQLPEVIFHEGLRTWLDEFVDLLARCQRGFKTIRVQGGELSILWLLPRVLRDSEFLGSHRDVELDIAQGTWQEFLQNLARDRIDLGLGPAVQKERLPGNVTVEEVLEIRRALICHKQRHHDLAKRPPGGIPLRELRSETIFVLSGDTIPLFRMREVLPKPEAGGRWIYVDSTSHAYAYVKAGLGVAIGYEKKYGLSEPGKMLTAIDFTKEQVPPAVICLYYRNDKPMLPETKALMAAIKELAPLVS